MLSEFFIRRPIFASVISILIVVAGIVSFQALPIEKFPDITPPVVRVTANYPGATAQTMADTVAAPIEQEVNGVDGMLYMSSTSTNDGSYSLEVTFDIGIDPDIATVLVQNRVSAAEPKLPEEVRRQGLVTKKVSSSLVSVMTLYSADKSRDDLYLANYLQLNVVEEMKRIRGVGDLRINPPKDYGMRIWLDPDKMQSRKLTTQDVVRALREQNVQVAAGQLGQPPTELGAPFQLAITTMGRLTEVEQFENIVVKAGPESRQTLIKDVARVELGARTYEAAAFMNDYPAASIILNLAPGANSVEVARQVNETMKRLSKDFPAGVEYATVLDVSEFINASVEAVYRTLEEAIVLVVVVILIFLQDWRTTLIPLITIPVSLIGSFIVLAALGFSINTLTLFGLVLAIGCVVDDAIVVVENVERNMREKHLPPLEASIQAMRETFGPIIAISLVLMAVFLPTAAVPGITGMLFKQFAVTIAVTTMFSAINALTLSPALCAVLLRDHHAEAAQRLTQRQNFAKRLWNVTFGFLYRYTLGLLFRGFSAGFNWTFERFTNLYGFIVRVMISKVGLVFSLVGFLALLGVTYDSVRRVPVGFLPGEDQGFIIVNVQLPDGASLERTSKVLLGISEQVRKLEGVKLANAIASLSLVAGNGSNNGTIFVRLDDWEERLPKGRDAEAILKDIRQVLGGVKEAVCFAFQRPAIDGLGNATGFNLRLLDKMGLGAQVLQEVADEVVRDGNSQSRLRNLNSSFRASVPQLYAAIDREKVKKLSLSLDDVFGTLNAYLGSSYVNDFNRFGRTYQVNVQAEAEYRVRIDDVSKLEVRNANGRMIPLGAVLKMDEIVGPDRVLRYNLYPSAGVIGEPALGVASGEAMQLVSQVVEAKLPVGMGWDWTALSYQENRDGGQGFLAFVLGICVVYLILAAQYESWTMPIAVVLSVPPAVLGAMWALNLRNMDNNIFTQIGLVLLIALAAKNAILIVEFARALTDEGIPLRKAALQASMQRFRPILMTSFTFILGVYPLVIATGAGASGRQVLGTAVFGGMIGGTLFSLLFTPVLYVTVAGTTNWGRRMFGKEDDAKPVAHP
ncbi:efflux RND transporter permease subunit [Tuwongella immobilis]|uniref:SSD domain-containing protein n=1 Tax=Tuwongella immobilis TaxID=692036 RepID=A0A6C2YL06_9BACT|nr:multidrug efflux RND transporter permease subunit [Tuwongella immobilis]VIP02260.1 hydrophobe amphiphile efflux-1 family transporter : Transporter OS=Candidatus Entotheonella sp. TSY2 GN=ETSY2_42875 PE=4 SV=1: ACR_tran [Tuwongella immobilis]VTS00867.1 hydrophobe amphiphile efflux-1 family transporter : Transporter OS=Candidatus Entotheonella sp. TSY2 GN=ETSY2_42875 PE=4 SV=1: ACR_tran [Tuwongella immobilis]